MSTDTGTNDLTYNLRTKVPVPRDPTAYRPSDHFHYRFKHRTDPSITGEVIETCLREGTIKNSQEAEKFFFEATVGGWPWRVVVAVHEEAFLDPARKHRICTAYCTEAGVHEDEPEEHSL